MRYFGSFDPLVDYSQEKEPEIDDGYDIEQRLDWHEFYKEMERENESLSRRKTI